MVNLAGLWLTYGSEYNLLVRFENSDIKDTTVYICEELYTTKYLLLVYDCIISHNQDLRLFDLQKRLSYLDEVLTLVENDDFLTIQIKPTFMLNVNSFFEVINNLFNEEPNYPTDGYIFTPKTKS